MKLYMKQKVFQLKEHFFVKDEYGQDKYEVKAKKAFTLGLKIYIYDMQGKELAYIEQQLLKLLPTFNVFVNGICIATIVKKMALLKPKYEIKSLNWDVDGDVFGHDYIINDGLNTIISIKKEWLTWGDSFVLDIQDPKYEVEALAVVLAIDHMMDTQRNSINIDLS